MNARVIKKRIKSVGSTRKITRTMELVSTAKAKRAQDRIRAAQPYALALSDLIASATRGVTDPSSLHPLCAARDRERTVALFVITANRGLCGGYNGNVFRLGMETRARLVAEGKDVELVVIGKKGAGYADFQKIPLAQRIVTMDDRPAFAQAAEIISPWMEKFLSGAVDRILVCATHYASASRQFPRVEQVLPVALATDGPGKADGGGGADYLWDPPPATLLGDLVPIAVKTSFLRILMEAAVSEQIARRIAMKSATENAGDLIKSLTGTYNRARQAQITQQIAEIVGGAEAIK